MSIGRRRWRKSIGYLKRGGFARFQGNLLRKHDVSGDEMADGNKAKSHKGRACLVDFLHVGRNAVSDAVSFATITADHIETAFLIKLTPLFGREPVSQETKRTRLWRILFSKALKKPAEHPQPRTVLVPEQKHGVPEFSAADQAREEQGFFDRCIKLSYAPGFAIGRPGGR